MMSIFWMCIGIVMVVLGFGGFIRRLSYGNGFITDAAPLLVAFGFLLVAMNIEGVEHEVTKTKLSQVENYYLDGNEVDPDTIDIDLYNYTIKGDSCYLTGK